ncbi:MAG: hypothetical protein AB1492_00935 [Bacillota bacterium]
MFTYTVGSGATAVTIQAWEAGDGLICYLSGGGYPHIGAAALATAHPSVAGGGRRSATASVITLPTHKDDELARPAALRLAAALGRPVVVVAGVHIGPPGHYTATPEEIQAAVANARAAVEALISRIAADRA